MQSERFFLCRAETKGWAGHSVRGLGYVLRLGRARSARPTIQFLRNSFVVARRVSGGSAGGPCAHAQGYRARRFFPSGAKTLLRLGLHRCG
jgi:hypothetical protein